MTTAGAAALQQWLGEIVLMKGATLAQDNGEYYLIVPAPVPFPNPVMEQYLGNLEKVDAIKRLPDQPLDGHNVYQIKAGARDVMLPMLAKYEEIKVQSGIAEACTVSV